MLPSPGRLLVVTARLWRRSRCLWFCVSRDESRSRSDRNRACRRSKSFRIGLISRTRNRAPYSRKSRDGTDFPLTVSATVSLASRAGVRNFTIISSGTKRPGADTPRAGHPVAASSRVTTAAGNQALITSPWAATTLEAPMPLCVYRRRPDLHRCLCIVAEKGWKSTCKTAARGLKCVKSRRNRNLWRDGWIRSVPRYSTGPPPPPTTGACWSRRN